MRIVSVRTPLDRLRKRLAGVDPLVTEGRVVGLLGTTLHALAPGVRAGERVVVARRFAAPLDAEVVGFDDARAVLMPLGDPTGVGLDDPVLLTRSACTLTVGPGLLGRVLDGLGRPCDGRGALSGETCIWPVDRASPDPLARRISHVPLAVGIRAIDATVTLALGQRVGLFAAAGAGKSALLGQIARQCPADIVVIALVGERGREVLDFIDGTLGEATRARACVVVATADAPAMVRVHAAGVATAIAEFFRDRGARVLLLVDSLTRVARAQREVGLAVGEPPARRGFPPSVFALLPRLIERAGPSAHGVITGVYTVLAETNDVDDPIVEEARSALDGHIVLDRALAARGHFPAVDVPRSLSRLMDKVTSAEHRAAAAKLRAMLSAWEARRDLMVLGAYVHGSDPLTDAAVERMPRIEAFLRQAQGESVGFDDCIQGLLTLVQ